MKKTNGPGARALLPLLLLSVALVSPACGAPDDDERAENTPSSPRSAPAAARNNAAQKEEQLANEPFVPAPHGPPPMHAAFVAFAAPSSGYAEQNLYPGAPPHHLATAPAETVDASNGIIHDVSIPTLQRYPVDESLSQGVAFVVFPGGSYNVLDMEREAAELAKRLGPLGISVFGLKSRVGAGSSDARRDALLDAERALRLLRSNASAWGLDASRIGTVSWSAGSHLALMLAGVFDGGEPSSSDPVERSSSRPDFMAVLCAWADGAATSPFSFTAEAPPIYLAHAADDTSAPIALTFAVERQLQAAGTLVQLEVLATGGHEAFFVGEPTATGRDWPDSYLAWLRTQRLIP